MQPTTPPAVQVGDRDLGGVVAGANGPETGVRVIAETADPPTKFAKIVVTDDRGRYLIPDPLRVDGVGRGRRSELPLVWMESGPSRKIRTRIADQLHVAASPSGPNPLSQQPRAVHTLELV
jgi:hypothetical protein